MISQETGMTILANFTNSSANQSDMNATINQTQNNQTSTQNNQTLTESGNGAKSSLWDWGKIPLGYELNENGTLTRAADEQWKPSI